MTVEQKEFKTYLETEIGNIEIAGTEDYITSVAFVEPTEAISDANQAELPQVVKDCVSQIEEYFQGVRQEFTVRLEPQGTDFQRAVWRQLTTIPYGSTVTYLEIANSVSSEKAVRAVGAANGQNPISIIIPCHRVIGSDGKLTGYGGGLWRKEWLLNHEGSLYGPQMKLF